MKIAITTNSTIQSGSYWPRSTEVNDPVNQIAMLCSVLVDRAMKVETAPTMAPSIMPTIGTITDDVSTTRRRNRKKIMVPTKAAATAPTIRTMSGASGKRSMTTSRPSPAHSVVPVVVGSTNRFWVSICMTSPHIAIPAPASTSATVRGARVMRNISPPSGAPHTSYTPTMSEAATRTMTTASPPSSGHVRSRCRARCTRRLSFRARRRTS